MGVKHSVALALIPLCEVAKHTSSATGLWIYDNKYVYDVTDFVKLHPGGNHCLSRKSNLMSSSQKDINYHSSKAKNIAKKLIIGNISKCNNCDCVYCFIKK